MAGGALESRIRRPARSFGQFPWAAGGAAAALAVALGTSSSPTVGIAVAIAIAAGAGIAANPTTILFFLATSLLIEEVRVGGSAISRVLAPIALVTVLIELVRGRSSIAREAPLKWAVAYSVWALASGLWTTSLPGTVFLLSSLAIALVYMLSFAALPGSVRDLQRVISVLVLASLVLGVLAFWHGAGNIGDTSQAGRYQGGVGDPNYFAAIQLVILPLVLVLARQAKKRWLEVALYLAALVNVASILTSLSRGGLIALGLLLVLIVVLPFHVLFRSRRNKAIALLVLALGIGATSASSVTALRARVESVVGHGQGAQSRGSGRIDLWKAAFGSVKKRPWLGLGYGAFPRASRELLLTTPGVDLETQPPNLPNQPAHNTYLESLAELGIAGPLLYAGLLFSTGASLVRTARRARHAQASFVESVAGALVLGLVTWSITSIFLSAETARALWIIIGLAVALPKLVPAETADDAAA